RTHNISTFGACPASHFSAAETNMTFTKLNKKLHRKGAGGFTLIELLVVISIISLLSSVVLSSLNSARARARDAKRLSDMRQYQTAIALYKTDNQNSAPLFGTGGSGQITSTSTIGVSLTSALQSYLSELPLDPANGIYWYCNRNGATGQDAGCIYDTDSSSFAIGFATETATALGAAGNYCVHSSGFSPATGNRCNQR